MVRILVKLFIYVFLFLSFSSYARGQSTKPNAMAIQAGQVAYAPDEVIVKLKNSRSGANAQAFMGKAQSQKGMSLKGSWGRLGMYHFKLKNGDDIQARINDIKNDPDVEYVEPNYYISKASITGYSQIISADEMHGLSGGSYLATNAPIEVVNTYGQVTSHGHIPVVAVIDTGLDTTHSVITGTNALWTNPGEIPNNGIDDDGNGYIDDVHGWNFVSNSNNVFDDEGHGTHVAGIILGVGVNIYTTPLQTSLIKIMPLKFLDGSGIGKTSDAIKAIYYAVNEGAQVLNNSWGGPSYSAALHEAIYFAYQHGAVFVAAAGNNGTNNDQIAMYPASYDVPNVISVAATNDSDALASFSNFGKSSVHLASPGVFIYSTYPGSSFGISSGTSMAAPFVSGLAGLMLVEKPNMLAYQAKQIITQNTDAILGLATKVQSQGRINVYDAIQVTKNATVETSQPVYAYSIQDRYLASTMASGGCGLVGKLKDGSGGGLGMPGAESWIVFLVVALIAVPLALYSMLRARKPQNRRRFERYKIDTEVRVRAGDRELIGSISTISLGGVQLNANALLDQGGIVRMSIMSPDGQGQIEVEGRVVWSEANKAYGIQFQEAKASALEQIGQWTKALTKA